MKSVKPFIMFQDGKGREALSFYMEVFPTAKIEQMTTYSSEEGGEHEGWIQLAEFTIQGQSILCSDSTIKHAFDFTPSFSFFIQVSSESELSELYEKLLVGGQALMPLGDYGFSKGFAWVNDRFGISWQLSLET